MEHVLRGWSSSGCQYSTVMYTSPNMKVSRQSALLHLMPSLCCCR